MIKQCVIGIMMMLSMWHINVQAEQLDRIVAVVNDEVILASELADMEQNVRAQLRKRNAAMPPADIMHKQVLERLIMERLQLQRAAEVGIRVGDDALNAAMKRIADNNKMTLRQFRDVLENDGFGFAEFRESIRNDMIISRLHKSQVEDRVVVSDREVDNFLATQTRFGSEEDAYHIQHILVSLPDAASPEQVQQAQQKVKKIQTMLADGADFAEVAAGYSDGQNALDGGDLGWRKKGELPSIFADVVPQLEIGGISEPIRSGSGFHIVKLAEKKSEETHLVKQTLASHILIKTNELVSDEQAKDRLEKLRERVINGDDFAELARAHSEDTGSAIDGGSLGWVSSGQMVPEFEEEMQKTPVGGVSEVFKSRFGWHLIKVYDRREENMAEEYQRGKAREQIRQRKINEEMESWLRTLRDEAYVEYRDE
jgi:peptidyl-prolyl cis-trans isomerase SurA